MNPWAAAVAFLSGLVIGAIGVYLVTSGAASERERVLRDSLAVAAADHERVTGEAEVIRDSLDAERRETATLREAAVQRRVEAKRVTVEAGEDVDATIASLRVVEPEIADSLEVQVTRERDGWERQLAALAEVSASLARDTLALHRRANTFRDERDAARGELAAERALREELERPKGFSFFGLRVRCKFPSATVGVTNEGKPGGAVGAGCQAG